MMKMILLILYVANIKATAMTKSLLPLPIYSYFKTVLQVLVICGRGNLFDRHPGCSDIGH